MKKSKIIIPAIILGTLVLGGALYSAKALADDAGATGRKGPDTAALAQKLGVDQSKVDSAMDEIRAERQKERQAEISTKLDQAVKDGVITAEQKQKILDKQAELQGQRGQKRTEMQQFYKDNGIDFDKIHDYIGFGGNGQGNGGRGAGSCRGAN